ncbi:hypothetical protein QJS10_CPA01g01383 [Acorus calamus]|uniref:PGG domain-containing protein n=1 Tax=Acorus calamus TaxID=4465 RepID=A0AAV9FGJ7_ACOCL|nr:hypothetical protein QJS10_CPA01g01383 [Acorus calamus]
MDGWRMGSSVTPLSLKDLEKDQWSNNWDELELYENGGDGGLYRQMDPSKNGVLAVQTIRNNIMASTVLATTAITLTSLIGVFVSSSSSSTTSSLIYGNRSKTVLSIKYFSILLCFLLAFLCNVQSIRYYAHVSFLVSVPVSRRRRGGEVVVSTEHVSRSLNRGSVFWSVGLRVLCFFCSVSLDIWADTDVGRLRVDNGGVVFLGHHNGVHKGPS